MAYDKSLDKELFSEKVEFETTILTVSVFSYNEAQPKLQISRQNIDPATDEKQYSKLGRMTKEEVEAVLPLIEKAVEHM